MDEQKLNPKILQNREKYLNDPTLFCTEVLGVKALTPSQQSILTDIRDYRRVSILGSHSCGKTFAMACFLLFYMCCYDEPVGIIFAPTFKQAQRQLWGEVKYLYDNALIDIGGNMKEHSFSFSPTSYLQPIGIAKSTTQQEANYGWKSRAGNLIMVADEASGINDKIFDSVVGSLASGGKEVLLGNASRVEGRFYRSFHSDIYHNIVITHEDVMKENADLGIKALADEQYEKDIIALFGKDSPEYKSKILASFPTEETNQFMPQKLREEAIQRTTPLPLPAPNINDLSSFYMIDILKQYERDVVVSIDPSYQKGKDRSVILLREGFVATIKKEYTDKDISTIAKDVRDIIDELGFVPKICVDGIGGAGYALVEALKSDPLLRDSVVMVNVVHKANDTERYMNTRSELYDIAKAWLKYAALCGDRRFLQGHFSYSYDMKYRLQIESKIDIRGRNDESPDVMDALACSFYIPKTQSSVGYTLKTLTN